jgi:predicted extracellular nuclease
MIRFSPLIPVTALFGLGFFSPPSYAILLGQYTFDNNSLVASGVASNVTLGNFGAGSGVSIPSSNPSGFAAGNPNPAIIRSGWGSGFDASDYFGFTVTPASNNEIDFTSLILDAQRSGTGPNQLQIRSSVDNFGTAIATSGSVPASFGSLTFDLSSLVNVTQPIDLRIYGTGATATGGTLRLDNVRLNGDINNVVTPPPLVPIFNIQGTGSASSLVGQTVATRGVVTGTFLGSDRLNGFFLQDNSGSNNPEITNASNGIFVSASSVNSLTIGSLVEVVGQVSESFNRTQLDLTGALSILGTGSIAPTSVTLPVASADFLERFEGMLVTLPQTLTVTNNFGLGRFGEVGLSSGDRLFQPTQIATPGPAANAVQITNSLNLITLDDGSNVQNPDPIPFPAPELTASNTLRTGDTIAGLTGALDFAFGSYRIQPTATPTFNTDANPRPLQSPDVGGNFRIGNYNLENYFTTLGSRGARTVEEFQRQQAKLVSALLGLNADIIGLQEVENNGYGSDSAIASLVNALNAVAGAGTYAFIDPGLTRLGNDQIAVGLVYKPSRVRPVGNAAVLQTGIFDPSLNRPSLAQTFIGLPGTERFTVNVNHFKSKGGTPEASGPCTAAQNTDSGDGQGAFNCTRSRQATELVRWLAGNPTGSDTDYRILLGDFNSYALEDPITKIEFEGYTNLDKRFGGTNIYSFQFQGQFGTLDYGFASSSLDPFVTGAAPWHINSDEPDVLGYSTAFKSPNQVASLYSPDQFAASDHDPLVIGLNLPSASPSVPEPSGLAGIGVFGLVAWFYRRSRR